MNVSEVLNRAADLIEERGWSTGSGWTDDGVSPLCLEGALASVLGLPMIVHGCDAYRAVSSYIGDGRPLFLWNDNAAWETNNWRSNRLRVPRDYTASKEAGRQVVIETLRAAAVIQASHEAETDVRAVSPREVSA